MNYFYNARTLVRVQLVSRSKYIKGKKKKQKVPSLKPLAFFRLLHAHSNAGAGRHRQPGSFFQFLHFTSQPKPISLLFLDSHTHMKLKGVKKQTKGMQCDATKANSAAANTSIGGQKNCFKVNFVLLKQILKNPPQ